MKKEIGKGILAGLLIPFLFLAALYVFFYVFDKKINNDVYGSGLLFGLGMNALYLRRMFKKNKDYAARGVMLASFVYFFIWLYLFAL